MAHSLCVCHHPRVVIAVDGWLRWLVAVEWNTQTDFVRRRVRPEEFEASRLDEAARRARAQHRAGAIHRLQRAMAPPLVCIDLAELDGAISAAEATPGVAPSMLAAARLTYLGAREEQKKADEDNHFYSMVRAHRSHRAASRRGRPLRQRSRVRVCVLTCRAARACFFSCPGLHVQRGGGGSRRRGGEEEPAARRGRQVSGCSGGALHSIGSTASGHTASPGVFGGQGPCVRASPVQ